MSQKIEASLNNYIGQKILTYIYDGTHLTQELKDKFKKSLIFLGYEGQIYNPLTNTYIGIGTTAYTNTKKYIKSVNDKVDALNQALTASLVSALYANFNDEELNKLTYYSYDTIINPEEGQKALTKFKTKTTAGIHATNEIIFKGIGDYDPETHQATAKEYIHVTSENVNEEQQEILTNSYFVNNERNNNPFATSGITVSLTKGKNIYRFNSKFLYNEDLHTYISAEGKLEYDIPESLWFEAAGELNEEGQITLTSKGYAVNKSTEAWKTFSESLQTYNSANGTAYTLEDLYEPALDNSNAQIYKNGKNVMTIDDKLTWSYIANAYAYTLDFTQKFTTNEVNRIYSEILGLSANNALIPVDAATIRNVIEDNNSYVFDANSGEFLKLESDNDNGLLYQTVLNTETKYYQKLYFNKDNYTTGWYIDAPEYDGANSNYEDEEGNSIFTHEIKISKIPVLGDGEVLNSYLCTGVNSIKLYANLDDAIADRDGEDYNISTYNVAGWTYITSGNLTSHDILVQGPQEKGGAEYNQNNGIEVYGGNYLLRLVTDLSQVSDKYDYVVVNKFNAENYNVNLSDGINTLKEAAYILDWITNGSMDPMNPEASGIEMAYSIAQNHIDIERIHDRLSKVEGGLNVVNNIRQLENGTHDYAYLNIKSNKVAYLTKSSVATSAVIKATGLFQNTDTEYDPHGPLLYKKVGNDNNPVNSYIAVLDSQVLEWNRLMTAYNTDLAIGRNSHTHGASYLVAPVFADIFGDDAVDDELYLVTTTTAQGVVENSYVGEVSLGIDLLTATTYTLHKYGHKNDTDGYVPVTINDVNKTTYITVAVPAKINNVVDYVKASFNEYRYSYGDPIISGDNKLWASIHSLLLNRFNIKDSTPDGTKYIVNGDYVRYSSNGETPVFLKLEKDDEPDHDSVSIIEVKYVIDTAAASNDPYDGVLYVKTGDTYTKATIPADGINGDLNSSALYDTYYFRYSPVNDTVKFAYLTDGLATTEWVQAFTYHSIKDLDGKFIESKVDSYNYAKQLINGLDSDANVRAGNTISSIKIENGRVSVSQTELPTDKIRINSTVWGEDTSTLKQYSYIAGNQVTESIALSHPIYVQYGYTYVLNPSFNNFTNAFTLVNGSDRKFDLYSTVAATIDKDNPSYIYDNSLSYGVDFAHYLPIYEKVNAYVAIDPADLVVTVTEKQDQPGSYVYNYTYNISGVNDPFVEFYKLSDSQPASSSVEYLTGSVVHHNATNGGKGENTIHLTAHITKIADANKDNTGLVDAYDVRETLSNMFEWVDLSEWTDKAVDTQNPLNYYGGERTTLPPTDAV